MKTTDKGGNILCLSQITALNAVLTPLVDGTTSKNLGSLNKSDIDIAATITKFKNEAGQSEGQDAATEGTTSGVLMYTDKANLDFLAFATKETQYLEYKYLGINNGNHQEVFKIVDVTPQMKVSRPGGATSMPYSSTAIVSYSALTFSTGVIASLAAIWGITIKTIAAVTIPSGQEHVIVETVVS